MENWYAYKRIVKSSGCWLIRIKCKKLRRKGLLLFLWAYSLGVHWYVFTVLFAAIPDSIWTWLTHKHNTAMRVWPFEPQFDIVAAKTARDKKLSPFLIHEENCTRHETLCLVQSGNQVSTALACNWYFQCARRGSPLRLFWSPIHTAALFDRQKCFATND